MTSSDKPADYPSGSRFDTIVIGSGIGGLTVASVLSQLRAQRVLVLEKHFKPGGFTHVFKRKGHYTWDVGIHYIGGLEKGGMVRELFDAVTGPGVDWAKMPDPFEKFVYPGLSFSVRSGEENFRNDLIQQFPHEKEAVERYFSDCKMAAGWFMRHFSVKPVPPAIEKVGALLAMSGGHPATVTTGAYLKHNIKDERLRAVVLSQWGDYGLPPSESAFIIHALIVTHYFGGGYYPVGGSGVIASETEKIIHKAGGAVLLYSEVTEVILDGDKAVGVKVTETHGSKKIQKEYFADAVVSDAGARNTYLSLVPESYPIPFREEIRSFPMGTSNVTLYIGFKDSPKTIGVHGENYWIYSGLDHDENFKQRNGIMEGNPSALYASFPSLKDPAAHTHTGELITFVDYEPFLPWKDKPWKNRGPDYDALKQRITDGLIQFADRHIPGFASLVDFAELSTPLSNTHFSSHPAGTIYGLPFTPDRFQKTWAGVRTPIQNLYLAGADASSPGVVGAMMGGFGAAAQVLGIDGMMRLLKELRRR